MRRFAPTVLVGLTLLFLISATVMGGAVIGDTVDAISIWIETLSIAFLGAILAIRRPDNAVGWLLLTSGFFYGLNLVGESFAVYSAVELGRPLAFSQTIMMLAGWSFVLNVASIGLLILLFPTGRLPSPRWRWAVWWIALAVPIAAISDFAVSRSVIDIEDFLANAWSLEHAGQPVSALISTAISVGLGLGLAGIVIGAVAMIFRLRSSTGVERQQLKWMLFAFAMFALTSFGFLLNNQVDMPRWMLSILLVVSGLVLPAGLAIALFRYRLYDIDRIISRTVSYGVVVFLLAGVFVAVVTLSALVLPAQSSLAVAASTLAIAALFNPVRRRVQRWVDRRFNRSRYNTQTVLDIFATTLQDHVGVDGLVDDWLRVVSETMEVSSAGVWIKEAN
ncbi:MAG: hypothetical protein WBM90_13785 [Acidimicrobiia bacterium]